MRIVYTPRALSDIDAIESYLGQYGSKSSKKLVAAIKKAIEQLRDFPRLGRAIDEEHRYRMPVAKTPYVVFYRINDDKLFVLHIRHGARRPIDSTDLS